MGANKTNPRTSKVALNGNAGAYTSIVASITCRRVEIIEDASATAQGLTYQIPDDGFTATYNVAPAPAGEPLVFGNEITRGCGHSPIIGWTQQKDPMGNVLANTPTTYCKLRSLTATATAVIVREYP